MGNLHLSRVSCKHSAWWPNFKACLAKHPRQHFQKSSRSLVKKQFNHCNRLLLSVWTKIVKTSTCKLLHGGFQKIHFYLSCCSSTLLNKSIRKHLIHYSISMLRSWSNKPLVTKSKTARKCKMRLISVLTPCSVKSTENSRKAQMWNLVSKRWKLQQVEISHLVSYQLTSSMSLKSSSKFRLNLKEMSKRFYSQINYTMRMKSTKY